MTPVLHVSILQMGVVSPGWCMFVHTHPFHPPVFLDVYLALNSLHASVLHDSIHTCMYLSGGACNIIIYVIIGLGNICSLCAPAHLCSDQQH